MRPRFDRMLMATLLICSAVFVVASAEEPRRLTAVSVTARTAGATLPQSARCAVRPNQGGWWFVSPQGEPFFSLGVCMFNQGASKDQFDPAKPSYAALRHYDGPAAWAKASVMRLQSWGFTTAGGWSDFETLMQLREENGLWMTPVVNLGARSGVPWFDMWDEKVVRRIEELAEMTLKPLRGNSRVAGYYSDNELGWWNAILWKMTLEQPASSGQRQRLVGLVRETYSDDWNRLLQDFEPQGAATWQELDRGGMLWLRPGGQGIGTMRKFLGLAADRYYQLMREAIHKFDPASLYLGDRYQSFYYPEVALASRRHVDVVSTNLNASWNDGTFINSYLDTLHGLTGKPILVSEFYMAADENQSGNRNTVGGFPKVADQRSRSEALSNTLRALVGLPYVVGADWFQYYDEPPHGRNLDGEDYNFGLVDIHDRPYAEVTSAFTSIDVQSLKAAMGAPRPTAALGVPPAPAEPLGNFQSMTALKNWDRQRGYVLPASKHPQGDLYVCWSPKAIYLATFVLEMIEEVYYRDGKIPDADRASWSIQFTGGKTITARVGAGKDPVVDRAGIRIKSLSGINQDVRCITAIELPAEVLGKAKFAAGDQISLESSLTTFARANRIHWQGQFRLSK